MSLRINTNIAALTAHQNMVNNDNNLTNVLGQLSSGLRINKAADDASGMAIADSLKSQALGLGQAVKNANDGISMVQTADGALAESINIVNSIKTKSIQAAQDGQTTDSRNAIQSDITKLMQELDAIAKTTSFNGQKLLSGQFTNKQFQVGAYTGETVGVSIGSSEAAKIGHVTTATMTASGVGDVNLSIYSNLQNQNVAIQSQTLAYDNTRDHSMAALADAINKVADITGITATASASVSSTAAVAAGTTGSDFAINGVAIGSVTVLANDSDGSLANAINQKQSQTGVTASVDNSGILTLTSTDGRAIQVTGDTGTTLMGSNLSTLGEIKLYQNGANQIKINNASDNVSLNLTSDLHTTGDTTTTVDSTLLKGSVLQSSSVLQAGSTLGFTLTTSNLKGDVTTTQDSTLVAGSALGSGSVIKADSILGGATTNHTAVATTASSILTTGTVLKSGSVLAAGTVVTTRIATTTGWVEAGTTLASDATLSGDATLLTSMNLGANSTIAAASTLNTGSQIGGDVTTSGTTTLSVGMTLLANSTIKDAGGTSILAGSSIGGVVNLSADVTLTQALTLKAGSTIGSGSTLAKGSTIGGATTTSAAVTLASDMTLAAGSQLASGSTLKAGTVLTNDITVAGGNLLKAGTTLAGDAITSGTNYLGVSMTLKANSVVAKNSVFAATATSASGASSSTALSDVSKYRLSDINVTTQDGAQLGIALAGAALTDLDKVRSGLGSVQNQLTSTISNLSATQVNITSAESSIRDVDFADASSNFSRLQILSQAGTFAMAQANASSKNVLSLLQG